MTAADDPCEHPTGTVVDPADLREGTRCDTCGRILPVDGWVLNDRQRHLNPWAANLPRWDW